MPRKQPQLTPSVVPLCKSAVSDPEDPCQSEAEWQVECAGPEIDGRPAFVCGECLPDAVDFAATYIEGSFSVEPPTLVRVAKFVPNSPLIAVAMEETEADREDELPQPTLDDLFKSVGG